MPKVLRIINRFNIGGPTYNAAYLTKYLSSDYETLLVGGVKEEHEKSSEFILENLGLEPTIVLEMRRSINPFQDYLAYRKIKKIIKDFKPDIVHTHAAKAGTLGRLAAINCHVPVIIHTFHGHVFHSYFGKVKTTIFKIIESYLAYRSTAIIAISKKQKEELCDIHTITSRDKCTIIPLGFDLTRFQTDNESKRILFRNKYNIKDDEIAIVIVGRVVCIKNHTLFLDALKFVLDSSNKKVRAFIVGDGDNRTCIEQQAKDRGIEFTTQADSFHNKPLCFTSWIKDIDVVYSGADIVALTSLNEGTPVSLIEAEAACKPIITTNIGGIEDIVENGVTGILVENNNSEAFGQNLLNLVEDAGLRERLSIKGRAFVNENYQYNRLVSDVKKLYDTLLENYSKQQQ
jgi:glycosyltransferase involved in cell wall biosynthesis